MKKQNLKNSITIKGAICALLLLTSCKNSDVKPNSQATPGVSGTWAGSMQDMKNSLTRLLPWVIDSAQYNDPQKQILISDEVKRLVKLSKEVNHSPTLTHRDPSVRFISNAFSEDLKKVEESLILGKREYARYSLMNVTAYCIECHTRTSTGPTFNSPELESALKKVGRLERGEYLLATREFDRALNEFEGFITERINEKSDYFTVDKAVRYALAVTVRFKAEPKRSMDIVEIIERSVNAPYYLKQNAAGWKAAILQWMKEKPTTRSTVKDKLVKINELIRKADVSGLGRYDKGGDIYFLRALSELHLLLMVELSKEQLGEVMYLTGVCYEAVKDLSIWTLHENYYESCVRSVPHTDWSKKCYKKLEESVYFGYTGSSGTRVPLDVQMRLTEMQKLAF